MPCKVARAKLFQYVDGELSTDQRTALERHLSDCAECRRLVELERSFVERCVAPLGPDPVPERLRAEVAASLRGAGAVPVVRWRRRVAAGLALFVVGLLAGLGLGTGFDGVPGRWTGGAQRPLMQLAAAAVDQHQKLARGVLPHDITQVTPKAAEAWFKARLNFNVNLPELARDDLTLVGGRIAHLRDLEVAALHFLMDGRDVSLFVIPLERYAALGIESLPRFKMVTHQGYDVIVWASHGIAYSLVSDIGGRSCLVCHSREDTLELPPGSRAHDRL